MIVSVRPSKAVQTSPFQPESVLGKSSPSFSPLRSSRTGLLHPISYFLISYMIQRLSKSSFRPDKSRKHYFFLKTISILISRNRQNWSDRQFLGTYLAFFPRLPAVEFFSKLFSFLYSSFLIEFGKLHLQASSKIFQIDLQLVYGFRQKHQI